MVQNRGDAESPLDVLVQAEKRQQEQPPQPVGTMRIEMSARDDAGATAVKLVIRNDPRTVELQGIVVREPRQGWLALDLPPLEAWEPSLRWLPVEQRERIESAEFYTTLQAELTRRVLQRRLE